MNITCKLAELLDWLVFDKSKAPYWIEIQTKNPTCTYYFGHFNHPLAAKIMEQGYIRDLIEEKAIVTSIKLKRENPERLTIIELETNNDSWQ